MKTSEEPMGRVTIEVTLANHIDVMRAEKGEIPWSDVAKVKLPGVIDTGATNLVIPEKVAAQLGLHRHGEVTVRYADHRTEQRPVAQGVWLEMIGREGAFQAVIEPRRDTVLVGAVVLEILDLLVDCRALKVYPRDPEHIIAEVE